MKEQTDKIKCAICSDQVHHIGKHLEKKHDWCDLEQYEREHPDQPIVSETFKVAVEKKRESQKTEMLAEVVPLVVRDNRQSDERKAYLHTVFGLGKTAMAKNAKGDPIGCTVFSNHNRELTELIPEVDSRYIFDISVLKKFHIGMEVNMPILLYGYHGTGKSTLGLQYCANTGRPSIRVQHTINTEEAHIVGQWIVKNNETVFELGPLAVAMRDGLVYIADEYDMALPHVLSVYQPVLEGHALYIKEASPDLRLIKPHKNFRFIATGNTNGAGDDTGLYQGTQVQNAANYSRFQIALQINYMSKSLETNVVASQAGCVKDDAAKLVEFGRMVRDAYGSGEIQLTVSPRELISAAKLGIMTGGDWKGGLEMAFINRLTAIDREAVSSLAQRIFG